MSGGNARAVEATVGMGDSVDAMSLECESMNRTLRCGVGAKAGAAPGYLMAGGGALVDVPVNKTVVLIRHHTRKRVITLK